MNKAIISEYFTLDELCKSSIGARLGIVNIPSQKVLINLQGLTTHVLDPIRVEFGATIMNSGFRCSELNKVIPGSSKKSQHQYGQAGDIVFPDNSIAMKTKVVNFILDNLVFDKLIIEYWNGEYGWIHISYNINVASNRKLIYLKKANVKRYTLLNRKLFNKLYPSSV